MTLLSQDQFLAKYQISAAEFAKTKLKWSDLEEIYCHHSGRLAQLAPVANFFRDSLQVVPEVHSLKVRIKDPEHVIEKIIRKVVARPSRVTTRENYQREITDLVGVRALHLFKDDWVAIHHFIRNNWRLKEKPVANIRRGDDESTFKEAGCKIKQHPAGYRSVHYIAGYQVAKELLAVEIQVRTIFEEGWSEIDHQIRYPRNADNAALSQFLNIFNGLSGSADHMGSYIPLSVQGT